jgi:hypothetical protein
MWSDVDEARAQANQGLANQQTFDLANVMTGTPGGAGGLGSGARRAAARSLGEEVAAPIMEQPSAPSVVNAGLEGPVNPAVQTVADPYRMMYPGIYSNPKDIAAAAAARVAPENPAMKQLFGVTRGDLSDMAQGRVGNQPPNIALPPKARGSASGAAIQTPENTQRLIDVLTEAGKYPGLAHADAWYIMDPAYGRMEQMFGAQAPERYGRFNTLTGMASPGSDVLTEIQRGTLAHALDTQGRFSDFVKYGGLPEAGRGADFPADMAYISGHPYHSTSQAGPMQKYIDTGSLVSEAPKVPLYVQASGVPQSGFQTTGPVGDAHFARGVGLADVRKGPTDVAASISRPEYQTLQPWWQNQVAAPIGLESVPAQARLWTTLGPQTGVESPLGAGKLELLSQQIMTAAKRLGVSPAKARDMILSGKAGAGAIAGTAGLGSMLGNMVSGQDDNQQYQ